MELSPLPRADRRELLRLLGYGDSRPDMAGEAAIEQALSALYGAVRPRYTYKIFSLTQQPLSLKEAGLMLPGRDIARHLEGCHSCLILALTLGPAAERLIRAADAHDAAGGLIADAAASALTESCADAAESILRGIIESGGGFLTGRFSPGYGDLSLSLQPYLLRLTGSQKAIGLTVSESNILLPRKSITALLGISDRPVTGHLAGCEGCAIYDNCQKRLKGEPCHGF